MRKFKTVIHKNEFNERKQANEKVVRFTNKNNKKIEINDIKKIVDAVTVKDPNDSIMIRGGDITNKWITIKGYNEELLDEEEYLINRVRETGKFKEYFYFDIYILN